MSEDRETIRSPFKYLEEKKSQGFFARNERKLSFLAFLAGFAWDGYFLTKISLTETGFVLGVQLAFIIFGIVVFNAVESKAGASKFLKRSVIWIPYVVQFMFGTLFNASLIFFSQSAELSSSWPFLLFISVFVLGNEIFHRRRDRLTFQIWMFFIAEFLYFVWVVPLVLGKMGPEIFVLSGFVALAVLGLLAYFVSRFAKARFEESRAVRAVVLIILYLGINALYFSDIIPPIPLSLRSVGVYHSVLKEGDQYKVTYEPAPSYVFWRKENGIFHAPAGSDAYVLSAVFAPTSIKVKVYHEWWYFDINKNQWLLVSKIPFNISGGREGGFRGFSKKEHIYVGDWRVVFVTDESQKIGRVYFTVVDSKASAI